MWEIDFAHSRSMKTLLWPWFREEIGVLKRKSLYLRKYVSLNQGQRNVFTVRECAQSIPRLEKPKNRRFSHKNPKMFDFRFNTPIPSLNQGQGSVFKVRECAQSILRMKLPPEIWFWGRNFKIFRFSLQYTHLFPWIRIKEAFSRFGNARNRFPA